MGRYLTVFYLFSLIAACLHYSVCADIRTIAFQGFEGSTNDTWSFSGTGSVTAAAAKTGAYGYQINSTKYLTLGSVSLDNFTNVVLQISCASTGGIENTDALKVYVARNSTNFPAAPDVTIMEGITNDAVYNAVWSYAAANVAVSTAGVPAIFYGDGAAGYATIRISIPFSVSNLAVKIAAANNAAAETYLVDDITISGLISGSDTKPVLNPIGAQSVIQGAALLLEIRASDYDTDPVNLSVSNLPPGAVFLDSGTGTAQFVWANPSPVGVYTSLFCAAGDDGEDVEPVEFTVSAPTYASNVSVSIMAANITSGDGSSYKDAGIRIFQALKPDVVCIQEFNYTNGLRDLVDRAFGTGFSYYAESEYSDIIPNGVVSRYPILSSGEWTNKNVFDRDFVWAVIDVPCTQNLYVVSVHFRTSSAGDRNEDAVLLKSYITNRWPSGALMAIAGDLNTGTRGESCITNLSTIVTDAHQPSDQNGDMDTSADRNYDYDYVLPSFSLNAKHTHTVIGGLTFPDGLVFDTRVWTSPPPPALISDSGSTNMQHMGVMKTFQLVSGTAPPTNAIIYTLCGPNGTISPTNPVVNLGQSQSIIISPSSGYAAEVLIDGASVGATSTFTFVNITNNHSVMATFRPQGVLKEIAISKWMRAGASSNLFSAAFASDPAGAEVSITVFGSSIFDASGEGFNFAPLDAGDYTVDGTNVTILPNTSNLWQIFRIVATPE